MSMDGGNVISSESESENPINIEERDVDVVNDRGRKSEFISSSVSKDKEDRTEKSTIEEQTLDSGDEYISDSSSDEEEKKKDESVEKEEKDDTIIILPSQKPEIKPFILNGMKITVRKKSTHKKSHRTIYPVS